jgi:hypothetical protein
LSSFDLLQNHPIPLIPIEIKNLPNSADNFFEIATLSSAAENTNGSFGRPGVLISSGPLAFWGDFSGCQLCALLTVLKQKPDP